VTADPVVDDTRLPARAPLVTLRGVSKAYRNPAETTHVLRDLDLDLHPGELVCLVGPSGGGKSTLLSLVAGLMRPDSGAVSFAGQDLADLSDTERAMLRATRIGVVLQSGNLLPFLTTAENIELAATLAQTTPTKEWVATLLAQVGLSDRAGHVPRRLSGGEAQRAALAVALVNSPDLLLADEAVGQLDTTTAGLVMDTFRRACEERGLAVLLVTHDASVVALGARVLRVVDGRLEATG
jgi:ABC-type lipoprotein export system ATPase subunit